MTLEEVDEVLRDSRTGLIPDLDFVLRRIAVRDFGPYTNVIQRLARVELHLLARVASLEAEIKALQASRAAERRREGRSGAVSVSNSEAFQGPLQRSGTKVLRERLGKVPLTVAVLDALKTTEWTTSRSVFETLCAREEKHDDINAKIGMSSVSASLVALLRQEKVERRIARANLRGGRRPYVYRKLRGV